MFDFTILKCYIKITFKVNYANKDLAKSMMLRWDAIEKLWFLMISIDLETIELYNCKRIDSDVIDIYKLLDEFPIVDIHDMDDYFDGTDNKLSLEEVKNYFRTRDISTYLNKVNNN